MCIRDRSKPEFFDHRARNKRIGTFAVKVVFGASQEPVSVRVKFQQPYAFGQILFIKISWIVVVLGIPISATGIVAI